MTDYIQDHEKALTEAFAEVINAENTVANIKGQIDNLTASLTSQLQLADTKMKDAWLKVKTLLDETGEVSVVLPGAVNDYEIYRTTPRESVKVVDPAAVPDTFCKHEQKPKLKEIGDFLRAQARGNLPLPNWASLETGESKLAWKAVKKTHATT